MTLQSQKKAWPDFDARHDVRGPTSGIVVIRDEFAVPHIRAETEADALFALGFVHAQDRLFQADLTRRVVRGELSELLGERTVEVDAFVQGLELTQRAERVVESLPFDKKALIEAYTLGFNAGIDTFTVKLPVEYELLGIDEVEPWRMSDCVASALLQSWNLSENLHFELGALALGDLPASVLDEVLRIDDQTQPIDPYWSGLRQADIGEWTPQWRAWIEMFGGLPEAAQGSNAWVVGGERSVNGLPILANDPHLMQGVPSLWYAVDLAGGDEVHVAGVTFPGAPVVVIGHNERLAWGLTNVMADYIDLALVERSDQGVIIAGEDTKLREVESVVRVKGGDEVRRTVMWTDIGPVLTELDSSMAVVLRWSALELQDQTGLAFQGLYEAQSVAEAIAALDRPMGVVQNVMLADVDGDWAWKVAGSVPRRKAHTGRVPYPASDPAHGWDGWIDVLPGEWAPERGWVVNANQRPESVVAIQPPPVELDEEGNPVPVEVAPPSEDDEPVDPPVEVPAISTAWAQRWRYDRIAGLLEQKSNWTMADFWELQLDVLDGQAQALLPGLLASVEPSTSSGRECKRILDDWDYQVDIDQAGPAVWAIFQREVLREALIDDLGDDGVSLYLQVHSPSRNVLGVGIERFLDDEEDRIRAVDRALTATCQRMESAWGEDPTGWMWGEVHPLRLQHLFARQSKLLAGWNAPEVPFPGNSNTVAAASAGWRDGEKPVGGMASVRVVMPLADLGASTLVYPGGQSGLPRHPDAFTHYDAFVAGETLPLWFADEDVANREKSRMVLLPPGADWPTWPRPAAPAPPPPPPAPEAEDTPDSATQPDE